VISINTRSPFIKPGLEVSVKAGERKSEKKTAVRWSQAFLKNKSGEDKFRVQAEHLLHAGKRLGSK